LLKPPYQASRPTADIEINCISVGEERPATIHQCITRFAERAAIYVCSSIFVVPTDDVPLMLTDEPSCADVRMSEERLAARLRSMLSQWHKSGSGEVNTLCLWLCTRSPAAVASLPFNDPCCFLCYDRTGL
jgi:hypothetical protein